MPSSSSALKTHINQIASLHLKGGIAPELIAVSKQQPLDRVVAALEEGHRQFGENRVQEAMERWPDLKTRYEGITLHLIGSLQTNKVKEAVALFDVIHTLDRPAIIEAVDRECVRQGKHMPCLIQVNVGEEPQKSGVMPDDLPALITLCRSRQGIALMGLMCLPPHHEPPAPYFALLAKWAKQYGLPWCSMGMSDDYETAIRLGATHIRLGTAFFGARA